MIPDYCEAITAHRAFDVCENGLLVGQSMAEPWPPYQAFTGRCGAISGKGWDAHITHGGFTPAPVWGCDCGIHALKSAQAAESRVTEDRYGRWFSVSTRERPRGRAWGTVKLWGRVIEHELGYRAEFAYPSELFSDSEPLALKIAALYGVPCAVKPLRDPQPSPWTSYTVTSGNVVWSHYAQYFATAGPSTYAHTVSLADDLRDAPMIHQPAPLAVKPQIVKANRWQARQYARQQQGPRDLIIPDWRATLRTMVFA